MFMTLCILVLVTGAYCDDDLDALIAQVFEPTLTQDKDNTQASTGPSITTNVENSEGNDDLDALLAQVFRPTATQDKDNTQASTGPSITTNVENSEGNSCALPDGQKGECVSYYLCNPSGHRTKKQVGFCSSYLDSCCRVSDIISRDELDKMLAKPVQS